MMFGALRLGRVRHWLAVVTILGAFAVLGTVATPPAQALYAKLWNTLEGPAIDGVVPTGEAHINQCPNPGRSFDLTVEVSNVNLPDDTSLTVTYGGQDGFPEGAKEIGGFGLTSGQGHFATTVSSQAGANDNLYVKQGETIILSATDRWDAGTTCP